VLSLSGTDSLANYQTVLQSVTYDNTFENPTTTRRSITSSQTTGRWTATRSPRPDGNAVTTPRS
jgi:hypothetical protein